MRRCSAASTANSALASGLISDESNSNRTSSSRQHASGTIGDDSALAPLPALVGAT